MKPYVEEREFVLRVVMRRSFAEAYDGEEDGYAWTAELRPVLGQVVEGALGTLSKRPGWTVRTANRGLSPEDEVTIVIER